jgi:hypothetical protein
MLEMLKAQGQSLNIRLILEFSIQPLTFVSSLVTQPQLGLVLVVVLAGTHGI